MPLFRNDSRRRRKTSAIVRERRLEAAPEVALEHFVGDSRELEHVVSRKLVRFAVATSLFSNAFHEGYSTRSFDVWTSVS